MRILVTGCAGFIGSNFVRQVLERHPNDDIVGLDKLTYAGRLDNIAEAMKNERFRFVHGDICDEQLVHDLVAHVDAIVNFAAESMVDRSVLDQRPFLQTNFVGVGVLLAAARKHKTERFLQISTPEVYGERLGEPALEDEPLAPRNLYAACKASAEMLALAYHNSFGVPVVITRGANAVGPQQHLGNVVPLFVTNALDRKPLPIYGTGTAVRDWAHVDDLNAANDHVLRHGVPGLSYNIATGNERTVLELAKSILKRLDRAETLIQFIDDRPAHDYRYYLNSDRLRSLGWSPRYGFDEAISAAVDWYRDHESWWRVVTDSEDHKEYLHLNYGPKYATVGPDLEQGGAPSHGGPASAEV